MVSPFGTELLGALKRRHPAATITHVEHVPARHARYGEWPGWVEPRLKQLLIDEGFASPYLHQAQCAEHAWRCSDVVVATGTSSGKSLGYQLPVLTTLAQDPTACAVYLTPTKALGSDQLQATLRMVQAAGLEGIHPAPYDGDTPAESRAGIREHTRYVFTNPDMLHASVLGSHARWARVLRHLKYVVVDECHTYRGVFGANVALVLRRLLRIAAAYGASPTVIYASATAADPAGQARRLSGREAVAITDDAAPAGERTIVLWEPGFIEGAEGEGGAPVRYPATTEAASVSAELLLQGARTLTFVRSRRAAETVAMRTQEHLSAAGRADVAERVAPYRAGYLAEDRRELERRLDNGELLGVASTNALELGIDVGGLDAVVMAGFPGTVASFRQQAGRAGRRGQSSVAVLVARDEPMDTYLVHHPDALLGTPVENSVFDPTNPFILRGHVYCAAVERPLSEADVEAFGARDVVDDLTAAGLLRRRPAGWFAVPQLDGEVTPESAHASVSLRGGVGEQVMIVDVTDGRLLGTVDAARAMSQVHDGAVYIHQGEYFVVQALDLDDYVALVAPERPDYSTQARSTTDITILGEAHQLVNPSPGLWVASVDVVVIDRVTGYVVRLSDGTVSEHIPLDLPEQRLVTRAVAYTIDPMVLDELGITAGEIPGALHAAEHAAIGLLPLLATCDRWDIGGVSTALHPDTMLPTVFVYDGHPGGAGFADEGFARFHEWIEATWETVRSCGCEDGCPSCVQSPKCGNGNQPLDKRAALKLLGALVTMTAGGAPR
ncbi:DEAD/DEAH box helicase [Corynebacterium afermentans subsp. lipophilum]|uniref:DEAD/DEAH box helicase n=1 Tax=Corynebacterium afermentans TaxID=38286 RepID=UPI00188A26B3|nr:DEAD/DEAH box helicase [Corynebacterium afermentans]MBF4547401.1 DEAD/DEAH box helicase [Corynebacterium afermentans subsp. lipophilum]WJY57961.1 putative ATP-dependent helicase Lhr [Corynebacterium afermentans subsp. lipophilum]